MLSVEPCAVFAKDDQEAREVKGRIQQNNLVLLGTTSTWWKRAMQQYGARGSRLF